MRSSILTAGAAALVLLAGCDDPSRMAVGEPTSIIIAAADTLWAAVGDSVEAGLEPSIFTVRDESAFEITHISPESEDWLTLRRFKQVLVIGAPDDFWVAEALAARDTVPPPAPAIVEAEDVWARNQWVTVLLVPPGGAAAAVRDHLEGLLDLFDGRFRSYVRQRMFVSGVDDSLRTALEETAGFSLTVPNAYRWRQVGDSAYLFINDNPSADQLVRSIFVTWRSGAPDTLTSGDLLDRRREVATAYYDWGQTIDTTRIERARPETDGARAYEVRGIWNGTVEGWPQAGPFITRAVVCADAGRTYVLDAWLYAPGKKKYEYVLQLETILGTFEC